MTRTRALAALLLLTLVAGAAIAWERDLKEALASKESTRYFNAVLNLDPKDGGAFDRLVELLAPDFRPGRWQPNDWYIRRAAMQNLAGAKDRHDELAGMFARADAMLKEGIAFVFGRAKAEQHIPLLLEALEDKEFIVRRAATLALEKMPDKRSVDALLDAWEDEDDERLQWRYYEALKTITGEDLDPVIVDWRNWRKGVGDEWEPPAKRGEGEGEGLVGPVTDEKKEVGTVLRDVTMSFDESGSGGPLFVLPKYSFNKDYLVPSLKALEDTCRIFYIDLPPLSNFKNLPPAFAGLPEYPVEKLCDAFDELRKQRKQPRIAILGDGMSAWVAVKYAVKYPQHVSHLVLVSTWSGQMAFGKGRDRLEQVGRDLGDVEQEHYAQSLLIEADASGQAAPRYTPRDQDDALALFRMAWTVNFFDRRDGTAHIMFDDYFRDMGGCIVPPFEVGKEVGSREIKARLKNIPTLIIYGKQAIWTDTNDQRMLQKYFPTSMRVECPHSNLMPMIEDYDVFVKSLEKFFRKFRFRTRIKDD